MIHLKNKIGWITGASSGIGEALAYACARQGTKLILSARREEELQRVKQACQLPEQDILALPLDLSNHEGMSGKVSKVMAAFGRIDVLVNNGGISQRSLVKNTDFSVFRKLIDVNYLGTVALTKAVLPVFLDQKQGHFVVVTSIMGKFGSPLRSGYCGAKHALHGFFDVLRMEHHEDNIDITLVCPGFVHTNVSMNALKGDGTTQQKMDASTEKGISAEECARKILQAVKNKKMEVLIGGKETLAVYGKRFFPRLLHNLAKKANVT